MFASLDPENTKEEALLKELKDPDPAVRWTAAVLLGERHSLGAVDALIQALQDEDQGVRRRAAEALGKIRAHSSIPSLIRLLQNSDGLLRQSARDALVEIGEPAVPALVAALQTPEDWMRWEIVEALGGIGSPAAAPALVDELEDEDGGIRWLAAEALSRMGEEALVLVLGALIRHSESVWLREGARLVLYGMAQAGLAETLAPVLAALDDVEPVLETPIAANIALGALAQMPVSPAKSQR